MLLKRRPDELRMIGHDTHDVDADKSHRHRPRLPFLHGHVAIRILLQQGHVRFRRVHPRSVLASTHDAPGGLQFHRTQRIGGRGGGLDVRVIVIVTILLHKIVKNGIKVHRVIHRVPMLIHQHAAAACLRDLIRIMQATLLFLEGAHAQLHARVGAGHQRGENLRFGREVLRIEQIPVRRKGGKSQVAIHLLRQIQKSLPRPLVKVTIRGIFARKRGWIKRLGLAVGKPGVRRCACHWGRLRHGWRKGCEQQCQTGCQAHR